MLESLSPVRRWLVRTALLSAGVGAVLTASVLLGHDPTLSLFGVCILLLLVAGDWIVIVGGARKSSQRDGDRPDGPDA